METLKFLLESKKADLATPARVVQEAVDWMHTQFLNASIDHEYAAGGTGLGRYSHFEIESKLRETEITLHIKIAEIHGSAYAFSEVRVRGKQDVILFPFFGEIGSAEGKLTILHYVADFILSTSNQASPEQS